ncbi:MarR family winged helix-turn-helix transcriptional regulator [Bacillus infantis]|uniref:MarR family winged helix-turn-helix transcriptional regulator n=1 Tax=Bacillus infantis TaxID=324767 RepID=UPI003CEDAB52
MDYKGLVDEFFQNISKSPKMPFQKKVNDLSHGERSILGYLTFIHNDVTSGELSEKLCLSTPRIAAALKNLAKKGYIERSRNDKDKRLVIVSITPIGRTFVMEEHEEAKRIVEQTFRKLGEHDAKEFVRIVKRIEEIHKEME